MKIIAFTGMPCSGKSEAVTIAKELKIPVVRMGDAVWEETKQRGLELTDKNVGKIANELRETNGKDIWARRTVEKIHVSLSSVECVIIDGIRNVEEIDTFKTMLGHNFILIAIEASDEVRQKRVLQRKRTDDSSSLKDIRARDQRELGWGLGKVFAVADIIVPNDGRVEDFHNKIKQILKDVMKR
ncbi:MAG: AAA family ATPase [Euryarchaeota archaeon]|nr:AAA family ATPase [Euryarchaeota archaeon]